MIKRTQHHIFTMAWFIGRMLTERFTKAGHLLIGGLLLSGVFGFNTRANLSYQIAALLLAILILSIASGLFFRTRFSARRSMPRYGSVNQPYAYKIEIANLSDKLQTNLSLMEKTDEPRPTLRQFRNAKIVDDGTLDKVARVSGGYRWFRLFDINQKAKFKTHDIPDLAPHAKIDVRATLEPKRRGRLRLDGLIIAKPDPFGIFKSCVTVPRPESILILPKLYPLRPISLPGSRKHQPGGVALASSVGESEEFASLRDYRPGDPIKRIHWRSWARIGKPVVKEFQEEYFVRYALILDTFTPNAGDIVFEEAVSLSASIAYSMQDSDSLLDLMFVGPRAYCFTSGRGLGHTGQMLEILAGVDVCRDKDFETLLPLIGERATMLSACVCVFIAWDEKRLRLIQMLQNIGLPIEVWLVTPPDFSGKLDPQVPVERFHCLEAGKIEEGLKRL